MPPPLHNAVGYALGLKNELKGTGVWGFINLKRDSKPKDGGDGPGGAGGGGKRSESSRGDVSARATTPAQGAPPRAPGTPAPSPRAPTRSARALPRAVRAPAGSAGLRSMAPRPVLL